MTYPIKIGIQEALERFADREMHEVLVAAGGGGTSAGRAGKAPDWDARAKMIGYIDLTTGRKCDIRCSLNWKETNENVESKAYREYFKEGTVYRVKGYAYELKEGESYDKWNAGITVSEILMAGEYNDYLAGLYVEWERPVTMESELFGQLLYDKMSEEYSCRFNWMGKAVEITVDNETGNAAESLRCAEELCRNCVEWDRKFRESIVDELLDLANDWLCDADEPEIDGDEFLSRITMQTIQMSDYKGGTFYVWYDDGDVFAGHSVTVYGTLEKGITATNMEG